MAGAARPPAAGLFAIAMATLIFELLLTRIFSVTMYYHYAFMAISIALFGMTAGAMLVFLRPEAFPQERLAAILGKWAIGFGGAALAFFLFHANFPLSMASSASTFVSLSATYLAASVPFFLSGVCVCLALTRWPAAVGRLYAADLAGAALGCPGFVFLLNLMDAPTAVIVVAALGALAGALFAGREAPGLRSAALGIAVLLMAGAAANQQFTRVQAPWLRLKWVKGADESPALAERWNSFSRVTVMGDPLTPATPFGWGFSPRLPKDLLAHQLRIDIDAGASTFATAYSGDPREIEFLKYDVTNIGHYLGGGGRVFVVGAGGGRDLLSALLFGRDAATGVEINDAILDLTHGLLGDLTGHLDRDPRITLVRDEARSYLARTDERYDMIQISLIDTFAATAAGAFVLSENSLYTREAWELMLDRLAPGGMLSVSRWHYEGRPVEMHRLVALAAGALKARGEARPRDRMMAVRAPGTANGGFGVGTLLVGERAFTPEQVRTLEVKAAELEFPVVLSPVAAEDAVFEALGNGEIEATIAAYPGDLSIPTDNKPFFFNMVRLRDVFQRERLEIGNMSFNLHAVRTLAFLIAIVAALSAAVVAVPYWAKFAGAPAQGAAPHFAYFSAIGVGFMFVEISQMQRLIVYLGHPTYALTVVLFTLLIASSLGAATVGGGGRPGGIMRLAALLIALCAYAAISAQALPRTEGVTTAGRMAIAVALLAPLGFLMGMALPMGMNLAAEKRHALSSWLWGVNGAMSVLASVLAMAVALSFGISSAFWCGVACYALAAAAYMRAARAAAHGSIQTA